jgi:hypothetical protein
MTRQDKTRIQDRQDKGRLDKRREVKARQGTQCQDSRR